MIETIFGELKKSKESTSISAIWRTSGGMLYVYGILYIVLRVETINIIRIIWNWNYEHMIEFDDNRTCFIDDSCGHEKIYNVCSMEHENRVNNEFAIEL